MRAILEFLEQAIRIRVVDALLQAPDGELRRIFNGPCMDLLEPAFARIEATGGIRARLATGEEVMVPVLLQVPRLEAGASNPPLSDSGRCDPDHFMTLRNNCKRFVVLLPPGARPNLSFSSASDEFGISAGANSGDARVDDWLADPFVRQVRDEVGLRLGLDRGDSRQEFLALFERAVREADELEHHSVQRRGAWCLMARLMGVPSSDPRRLTLVSLACGVPPTTDGRLQADYQAGVLQRLAGGFSESGFRTTLETLQEGATAADSQALAACLVHITAQCSLAAEFEQAPTHYYRPGPEWELQPEPGWWIHLTAERWHELLQDDDAPTGEAVITCTNSVVPHLRNLHGLVLDQVEISIAFPGDAEVPQGATLVRNSAGRDGPRAWELETGALVAVVDDQVPRHKAPMRYVVEAANFRKASAKIISLAHWEPGVIVDARTARKSRHPRTVRGRANTYDSSLVLDGPGRHYVDVFVRPGVTLEGRASFLDGEGQHATDRDSSVLRVSDTQYGFDIEAGEDCQYELEVTRPGAEPYRLLVGVSCEEASPEGCSSEFERLIRLNRQGGSSRSSAEVIVGRSRTVDLQAWSLEPEVVALSWRPSVLAPDLGEHWRKPGWASLDDSIFSRGRFLCDPRPQLIEMVPPAEFVACRERIARRIRGDDSSGVLESARLAEWAAESGEFAQDVTAYLSAYRAWIQEAPTVAPWADISIVHDLERDGQTLTREPVAVIISPLHPVRLAWHLAAQRAMWDAHRRRQPCPAASILDPHCIPDVLYLPVRTASGSVNTLTFFAADHSSDYWSVLWNAGRLDAIPDWADKAPFDRNFGLQVGGMASGFSVAQVRRALDDITELRGAKPTISVLIASAAGQTNACNEGVAAWARSRLGGAELEDGEAEGIFSRTGARRVQILDERPPESRPDGATIANLAEDTSGSLRWMEASRCQGLTADLGIVAQLETSNGSAAASDTGSPLAPGALLRHRVRKQLSTGSGAFLSESRSGVQPSPTGDPLLDALQACVALMENMGPERSACTFAPSVRVVQSVLQRSSFATVSSSAVDPACFLGTWLEGSYLWDYELPSYSRRAGDSNGYYLLSQVKPEDAEALAGALAALPGPGALPADLAQSILHEVASRGIPTVRGLSAGDHGAAGDVGLFIAARLLQDEFREGGDAGLLRTLHVDGERRLVNVVIPVDPFKGYLKDLQKALGLAESRPDLLVASFDLTGGPVRCRLTPVEVKYRSDRRPMVEADRDSALKQARSLSELLERVQSKGRGEEGLVLWRLAYSHLLTSMVSFGLRVYSQRLTNAEGGRQWARHHEQIVASLLGDESVIDLDARGRLIVIDSSPQSRPLDQDGDGFPETIILSLEDAGTIARELSPPVATAIRNAVGSWDLLAREGRPPSAAQPPQAGPPQAPAPPPAPAPVPGPGPQATSRATPAQPSPLSAPTPPPPQPVSPDAQGDGFRILVGRTQGTFSGNERWLDLSDTRLNQLNMGVVGDLGTGKTQLLKSLILQVSRAQESNRGVRPRMLVFDYKKDYSAPDFVQAVGARVVQPRHLPLNLFDIGGLGAQPNGWMQRYKFFADTLGKIYSNIGPVQLGNLKNAVRTAYESSGAGSAPTLADVREAYRQVLGTRGADSPFNIIDDLVDMEVFDPRPAPGANFANFMDGVVVLSLGELGQDDRTKNMIVAVMLNMFYEHMLTIPKRPYIGTDPQRRVVDSFLLVDEADNIMKYEFDVLRKLLLQGREFGVGVILASQYLRHFKAGATDYREPLLTWFVHKVPNVAPPELGALGLTDNLADLADDIKRLEVHHCLYKTVQVPGEIVRATPFFELVDRPTS